MNYAVDHWLWWSIGLILITLELILPGVFFLWFAISAAIVGFISLIFEPSTNIELLLFALFSVPTYIIFLWYDHKRIKSEPTSTLNKKADQFIGHIYALEKPLAQGEYSQVKIGHTFWKVTGDCDLEAGTKIKVISTDGIILTVVDAKDGNALKAKN